SGLDPIGCREVKDLITALARRGKTVILSSHLLADVEDVCDRAVIYYGGRVQAMGTLKELLAKPDSVRITTPALSRDTMERVLELIRKDVAADKVRVDTPSQNLESYFLGVVERARQAAAETSGATSGARVAAYLRSDQAEVARSERLLERLAAPQPQPAGQPPAPAPTEPKVDDSKLESLTRQKPAPSAPAPKPASQPTPEQMSKANEKLAALTRPKDAGRDPKP
ncbi:MAG: ABC transporter ATP-binding protein, partial [Verrucomicrobia bacterium]|nr:ABC transporter ATP-binding protein [Verrucomicrobiota bacterium]